MTTNASARTFSLGSDFSVNRLGYGAMRLTGQPGNFGPYINWEDGKTLLRRAVELGVNHIDTARAYGPGWNEALIAEALWPYHGLLIATKGGIEKSSPSDIRADGRPEALARHIEESRAKLKVDTIDLYYLHRPDPTVPFAAQIEALAKARVAGEIRMIGLSNVSVAQLQEALAIVPIAAVQNRFNIAEEGDAEMLRLTREKGIAYVPWGPLGAAPLKPGAPLAATGAGNALAALLARSENILPIPGTTSIAHLEENIRAASI